MKIDILALRQLIADIGGEVDLSAGCLADDDHPCNCAHIFDGGHAGGIGQVYIGNGLPISDGGNDCPDRDLAKAYLRLLVGAANALPALLDKVEKYGD